MPDLSGIILAGGQSKRMGRNKALLRINGVPLIQILALELETLADKIFISANDPATFAFLGLRVIADLYRGQGPLAGLHAAMIQSDRPMMLLLACDLPRVRAPLLRTLVGEMSDFDAVIPKTSDSRVHPLCAVYRRTCLATIERNLAAGKNKMTDIFEDGVLRVKYVASQAGGFRDEELWNLNYPEDLEALEGLAG